MSSSVPAGQAQPAMTKGTQHGLAKRCSLPLSLPAAALRDRQPPTGQAHRGASNLAETAVCARLSGTSSSPIAAGGCLHLLYIPFAERLALVEAHLAQEKPALVVHGT